MSGKLHVNNILNTKKEYHLEQLSKYLSENNFLKKSGFTKVACHDQVWNSTNILNAKEINILGICMKNY